MTHYRTCNLCEALCGLAVETQDSAVTSLRGDAQDPFSRGHICPKAVALPDIYADPERLRQPLRRTAGGWHTIGWDEALGEVAERLQSIQAQHGPDAVGVYQGNPSIHNLGTMLNAPAFFKSLRTKNIYSATSADQLPHHFAAWLMFGHPLLLPVPDIDRTDYMLILGANPLASNGSMMTAPGVGARLQAIQQRGGKLVVLDPRLTETARRADEHHFIRPGSDVLLLLALTETLFAEDLVGLGRVGEFTDGLGALRAACTGFTPEVVAPQTGIDAAVIRRLAREFAAAPAAVCYGRVGVSTQAFGGLCQWLINVLNILTGNLDRPGGAMFPQPAFDLLAQAKPRNYFARWHSRVRRRPEFMGELPVVALAEEILTPGAGQIKALITSCGNPVLSTPNGRQLDKALSSLEFMVAIDIYRNETTRHADIILPPATGLENSHYDVTFHHLAIRNTAKYSPALFPKADDARYDWEIFQELTHRYRGGTNGDFPSVPPEIILDAALRAGPYGLSLADLQAQPHGVDLGALQSCLPSRLVSDGQRIDLAPALLLADIARARQLLHTGPVDSEFPLQLIGRRHLRDNNSWLHNTERLMKGRNRCTLLMNPADAARLGVAPQQSVTVTSRVGSVHAPVQVTETMAPGVVSLPHGYGHGRDGVNLSIARSYAGVSSNDLTDEEVLDELTGTVAFSNVRVRVEPLELV